MPTTQLNVIAALAALCSAANALAYPEGAPWGAANPDTDESCASCHFDAEPVRNTPRLVLAGLPERLQPGQVIEFELQFTEFESAVAGFQLLIDAGKQNAGTIFAKKDKMEAIGAAVRSTEPSKPEDGQARWAFTWQVPALLTGPVDIHAAALAGNDDGSPLGDKVHFRTVTVHAAKFSADK